MIYVVYTIIDGPLYVYYTRIIYILVYQKGNTVNINYNNIITNKQSNTYEHAMSSMAYPIMVTRRYDLRLKMFEY